MLLKFQNDSNAKRFLKIKSDETKEFVINPHRHFINNYTNKNHFNCFLCDRKYQNISQLESHLINESHLVLPGLSVQDNEPWCLCKRCGVKLLYNDNMEYHKCTQYLKDNLETMIFNYDRIRLPLFCIICENNNFSSICELVGHLICFHSEINSVAQCSICNTEFLSNNSILKYQHFLNEHIGTLELNLLQSRRIDLQNRSKPPLKSFTNPLICVYYHKNSVSKPRHYCNKEFDDLVSLTVHILCTHCYTGDDRLSQILEYNRKQLLKQNLTESQHIWPSLKSPFSYTPTFKCTKCPDTFKLENEFNSHIQTSHMLKIKQHFLYNVDRKNYKDKIDLCCTCLFCIKVFPSNLEKQIHIYCCHYLKEWNVCGLCNEVLIDIDKDKSLSLNITYKILKAHENNHVNIIKQFMKDCNSPDNKSAIAASKPKIAPKSEKETDKNTLDNAQTKVTEPNSNKIHRESINSTTKNAIDEEIRIKEFQQNIKEPKQEIKKVKETSVKLPEIKFGRLYKLPLTTIQTPEKLYTKYCIIPSIKNTKDNNLNADTRSSILKGASVLQNDLYNHFKELGSLNRLKQESIELFD